MQAFRPIVLIMVPIVNTAWMGLECCSRVRGLGACNGAARGQEPSPQHGAAFSRGSLDTAAITLRQLWLWLGALVVSQRAATRSRLK